MTPGDVARLDQLFRSTPSLGYDLVAAVGPCDQGDTNIPWFGDVADAAAVVRLVDATGVMVCPAAFGGVELRAALRTLQADGVHVHVASGLEDVDHRRLRAVGLGGQPFLYLDPPSLTRSQLCAKRVLDVVLASVLLLVALPVLVVAAAAVKLGDGGPIMFRQERVGRDGRRFKVHKLRTMEVDAEARLGELVDQNERSGPLFKIAQDPRVTRVGRFLRTSSIDELPQLLDVLRGSMSLVGPRPALPREVELFDEELLDRLRCTPGVTGLWQVEARDEAEFETYRHLDLFYVENWSLLLDLTILARTIPAVVGRGLERAAVRLSVARGPTRARRRPSVNKRPSPTRAPAGDGRHVTIIVQNMPVPLDRRVWLECQTLVDDGYRVSVVCPKGPGDPPFEVIDGVRLHKYAPRTGG